MFLGCNRSGRRPRMRFDIGGSTHSADLDSEPAFGYFSLRWINTCGAVIAWCPYENRGTRDAQRVKAPAGARGALRCGGWFRSRLKTPPAPHQL